MIDLQSSQTSSLNRDGAIYTPDMVEERMVEALQLWRRSPGDARWPFAKDAPWQLMTRTTRMGEGLVKGMDLARLLQADDEAETRQWQGRERPRALTRDEVARRDEASGWIVLVPDHDRQLVVMVVAMVASGRRVSFIELKPAMGIEYGADGLRKRYRRALAGVATALNRAG